MSPIRTLLLFSLLLPVAATPLRAEEDDPVYRGKKLSEWRSYMENGKTVQERKKGLIVLQLIGPRRSRKVVTAFLVAVRDNTEPAIRAGAAHALGGFAAGAKEDDDIPIDKIRDALSTALRTDKAGPVREASAKALGEMKDKAYKAVAELARALKDSHKQTRTAAAAALRKLGPYADQAIDELQAALRNAKLESATRIHCAGALGRIGTPDAVPAIPALKEVLGNAKTDSELRKECAQALGEMGKDAAEAAPTLAGVLSAKDTDTLLRRAAAGALDQLGADARPALSALRAALKDDDQYVRSLSLHAIGQMGKELGDDRKAAILGILERMDDNVLEVRVAAIAALGNLGAEGVGDQGKNVTNRLTEATRDPRKEIREAAKVALKKLQGMS